MLNKNEPSSGPKKDAILDKIVMATIPKIIVTLIAFCLNINWFNAKPNK